MNRFKRLTTDTILNIFKRHVGLPDLVYGNGWIALGAALLSWQSRFLLEGEALVSFPLYELLLFGGTLLVYSGHRLLALNRFEKKTPAAPRLRLLRKRAPVLRRNALIGSVLVLLALLFLPVRVGISLILPGLLALFYSFPFPFINQRLREFPWTKTISLALAWAWLTVWIPLGGSRAESVFPELLLFFERGLFLFGLCIPFDIRDASLDKQTGANTLPRALGVQSSLQLAVGSLGSSLVFSGVLYLKGFYPLFAILAITMSMLLTSYLVWKVTDTKPDWYYAFWLDGMLVFQPLLLLLTSLFPG